MWNCSCPFCVCRWCICSSRWSMQSRVAPWTDIDTNRAVIHRAINCRIRSLSSSISANWPIWGVLSTSPVLRPLSCRCHHLPGRWQLHQRLVDERRRQQTGGDRPEDYNAQSVEIKHKKNIKLKKKKKNLKNIPLVNILCVWLLK